MKSFRRQLHYVWRRNRLPIFVVLFVSVTSLLIMRSIKSSKATIKTNRDQSWADAILNQAVPNDGDSFYEKNECINRSLYNKELIRILNLDPTFEKDYTKNFTLVIGANTTYGRVIVAELQRKFIPTLQLEGIYSLGIGFGQEDILANLKFERIIFCDQSSFYYESSGKNSFHDSYSKYLISALSWASKNKIQTTILLTPPIDSNLYKTVGWYGASILIVPYTPNINDINDLGNPFVETYLQCKSSNKATIYTNKFPVAAIKAEEIIPFVFSTFRHSQRYLYINGANQDTLDEVIPKLNVSNCKITTKYIDVDTDFFKGIEAQTIGRAETTFQSIYDESIKEISVKQYEPYLSIVISGKQENDGDDERDIINHFLERTSKSYEIYPEASFEILISDFSGSGQSGIHKSMKLPNNLRSHVKIIVIPDVNDSGINTAIGANVGIRRAKGKFTLLLDPKIIIPHHFWRIVSKRQFSNGFFYTAPVVTINNDVTQEVESKYMMNPWIHQKSPYYSNPTFIVRTYEDLMKFKHTFHFITASTRLWNELGGLNVYPSNKNLLHLAKLMQMKPGIPIYIFDFCVFMKENDIDNDEKLEGEKDALAEFACYGDSRIISQYISQPDWGFKDHKLRIYLF